MSRGRFYDAVNDAMRERNKYRETHCPYSQPITADKIAREFERSSSSVKIKIDKKN